MPDTRELRSVVDAAEQAAATGDYASAEQFLREAARRQEAQLGPLHPDLANTLNNLGVVCEITDKPADAELCYRRAYAIATAALEPGHPFVATSGKNLRAFCEARGKSGEAPIPPLATATEPEPPPTVSEHPQVTRPPNAESRPFVLRTLSRPLAIGAVGACGLVFLVLIAGWLWFGASGRPEFSPGSAGLSPPVSPAPTPGPVRVEPPAVPRETATNGSGAARVQERRTAASAPPPGVADAQICRDLSTAASRGSSGDWRCDRPSLPVAPGLLFFYTRVKSATDTTIQHRWYWGDQLRQVVELQVRASPTEGYRTFSRNTIDTLSGGDWRVELRTKDGILLHEERFVVR
jgi:hypothetical protein